MKKNKMDRKYKIKRYYDLNDIDMINTIVFCHGNTELHRMEIFQDQTQLAQLLRSVFREDIHFITIDINPYTKPSIQGDIFNLKQETLLHNKQIKNVVYMNATLKGEHNIISSIFQLFQYNIVHPTQYNIICTNMINLLHRTYLKKTSSRKILNQSDTIISQLNKQFEKIYSMIDKPVCYDYIKIFKPCNALNTLIYLYVQSRIMDECEKSENKYKTIECNNDINTFPFNKKKEILSRLFSDYNIIRIREKEHIFNMDTKDIRMIRGPYHGFHFL